MTARSAKRQRTESDLLSLEVTAQRDQIFPGDLLDIRVRVLGAAHHRMSVAGAPYTVHLQVIPPNSEDGDEYPILDCAQDTANGDAGDAPAVFVPQGDARLSDGNGDFCLKILPKALNSSLQGISKVHVLVRVARNGGSTVEGVSKNFDSSGSGLPRSEALQLCHQKLLLDNDKIPNKWFKDEGGQANCVNLEGQLVDACGKKVCEKDVRCLYNLFYEDMTLVKQQSTLLVSGEPNTMATDKNGAFRQSARIKEVSMRHQNKKFIIKISTGRSGVCAAFTKPIEVRSKRKAKKRREDAALEEKKALLEGVSNASATPASGFGMLPGAMLDGGAAMAGQLLFSAGVNNPGSAAAMRRVCEWIAKAHATLSDAQWMHVGYEHHENGNLSFRNKIYRCPSCGAFKVDMVAENCHKEGCRIKADLDEFEATIKPIFEILVQRLGYSDTDKDKIHTLVNGGSTPTVPSAANIHAMAMNAPSARVAPYAVPPGVTGRSNRPVPIPFSSVIRSNDINGSSKGGASHTNAAAQAAQAMLHIGERPPPKPLLQRQSTIELVKNSGAVPEPLSEVMPPDTSLDNGDRRRHGRGPLSRESSSELDPNTFGALLPPSRDISDQSQMNIWNSSLGDASGLAPPAAMMRGISEHLMNDFEVDVPESLQAVVRMGMETVDMFKSARLAFDRSGNFIGRLDERMEEGGRGIIYCKPAKDFDAESKKLAEKAFSQKDGRRRMRGNQTVRDFVRSSFDLFTFSAEDDFRESPSA